MIKRVGGKALSALLFPIIKRTGSFKGKWRLIDLWMRTAECTGERTRVLPGGGKVTCDLAIPYEVYVWLGQEEQQDLEILRQLLQAGDTFVDCGANIGIWSLVAASAVGEKGKVFSFEPNPGTVKRLSHNVAQSQFNNVQIVPAAVGESKGQLFLQCETEHNNSRVVESQSALTVPVKMVTLDSAVNGERIAGCKIDVEGFELNVLKGAQNMLQEHHPWLCVEFNPGLASTTTLGQWTVHQHLAGLGYVARRFRHALTPSPQNILPDTWNSPHYCNLFYMYSPREGEHS